MHFNVCGDEVHMLQSQHTQIFFISNNIVVGQHSVVLFLYTVIVTVKAECIMSAEVTLLEFQDHHVRNFC